jgi:hypothetical protein
MIGIEGELRLVPLRLAQPVELLDRRAAVRAVLPLARGTPRELGRLGRALQRLARVEQRLNVHTVLNSSLRHGSSLLMGGYEWTI